MTWVQKKWDGHPWGLSIQSVKITELKPKCAWRVITVTTYLQPTASRDKTGTKCNEQRPTGVFHTLALVRKSGPWLHSQTLFWTVLWCHTKKHWYDNLPFTPSVHVWSKANMADIFEHFRVQMLLNWLTFQLLPVVKGFYKMYISFI